MIIHISQSSIRHNVNTGDNQPVIAVHDDSGETSYHHSFDIPTASRVVYDPTGIDLDGSIIRVWIEVDQDV